MQIRIIYPIFWAIALAVSSNGREIQNVTVVACLIGAESKVISREAESHHLPEDYAQLVKAYCEGGYDKSAIALWSGRKPIEAKKSSPLIPSRDALLWNLFRRSGYTTRFVGDTAVFSGIGKAETGSEWDSFTEIAALSPSDLSEHILATWAMPILDAERKSTGNELLIVGLGSGIEGMEYDQSLASISKSLLKLVKKASRSYSVCIVNIPSSSRFAGLDSSTEIEQALNLPSYYAQSGGVIPASHTVGALVGLDDHLPTLCDMARIDLSHVRNVLSGRSLCVPLYSVPLPWMDLNLSTIVSGAEGFLAHTVRDSRFRAVYSGAPAQWELFDYAASSETRNDSSLADQFPQVLEELKRNAPKEWGVRIAD